MANSLIKGTSTTVRFSRVVDGDTIRIYPPSSTAPESVRILSLDTEESWSVGSKPVTPWGKAAKQFATSFFAGTELVTIEFPCTDSLDVAFDKYRGNFGRLLVWVYKDGVDFVELMIRKGYSPYYNKYGNAEFATHHARYTKAERHAQMDGIGVWDQISVNGSVLRDYPRLTTWWHLRATIIDDYRRLRAVDPTVYNTRKDYAALVQIAKRTGLATVFTEVRTVARTYGDAARVDIGSRERPFSLYIPDSDDGAGTPVVTLLKQRYISDSENVPRRSYCYATGQLRIDPRGSTAVQMIISSPTAITDILETRSDQQVIMPSQMDTADDNKPSAARAPPENTSRPPAAPPVMATGVKIASLLPDPVGEDYGRESVTLKAGVGSGADLSGWLLKDRAGRRHELEGSLTAGEPKTFVLRGGSVTLNNGGDTIYLVDDQSRVVHQVSYGAEDVKAGVSIDFQNT